ncbi:MAG: DctP family TRAP transporter solute-binding subunit [Magnetococcus sp. MYC-9]
MRRLSVVLVLLGILALNGWAWRSTLKPSMTAANKPLLEQRPALRFGHNMPKESAMGVAAEKFAQTVEAEAGGALQVSVHPAGSLGNDLEMAELARNGELDIVLIPTAKMSVPLPAMQFADLPFYFPTPEHLYRQLDGEPGQLLLAKLRSMDLVGATFWGNGFKQFTANRPIHAPSDLREFKVRVMKSRLIMDQFENLGAKPVAIEFRETRQALADGVVDGQENPLAAIVAMGIHRVQSHLTLSDHAYLAYVLAISQKSFARLSDKHQTLLLETAKALTPFQRQETARQEEQFLQQIQDAGVKVNRLSGEEKGVFARLLRHIPWQFEDVIGSDVISKSEELLHAGQSPENQAQQILVGLDADFSPSRADTELAIKRGALLAMEEINRAGGVLGKQLVLLSRDDRAMPDRGQENFRSFAENKALVAILGGRHSMVAIPQSTLADQLQVPFLVPWAAAAQVVEQGGQPFRFVFRISANDRLAGPFLVDSALQRGSRVALVLENSSWGQGMLPHLQKRFQELTAAPVLVAWVNRGETELSQPMRALQDSGANVALLMLHPDEGAEWLRALAVHLPALPLVAHWGITGKDFFEKIRGVQDKTNLSFLQTFSLLHVDKERMASLQQAYQTLFDQPLLGSFLPHSGFAHAYDLVHLLARAIIQAGSTDRHRVRDALEQITEHDGLTKRYRAAPFTASRHEALERADYFLARYDASGHIVPVLPKGNP